MSPDAAGEVVFLILALKMNLWGRSPTCRFRQIGNLPYDSMAHFLCKGQQT